MIKPEHVHVIGGGLVGALTSIFLAKRGFEVSLFERRGDMRKLAVEAGRSINLAVTARGLKALDEVGLKRDVLDLAITMKGRMVHDMAGNTTFVSYGQKENEVIYSVSRGELNKLLLTKAGEYSNVHLRFDQRCVEHDLESNQISFTDEVSKQTHNVQAKVALATDGAWSVARQAMLANVKNFNYAQNFESYGYKELVIPAAAGGAFQLEKEALHIWPRQSFMLIALPNLDGSFTCTLFLAYEGAVSFAALKTATDVNAFFAREFAGALALMPTLAEDFFRNPTGALTTIRCAPWHVDDKLLLLGDAAHAIVPFFGQGMNCGFEDCSTLGVLLDAESDWRSLFQKLEAERKPNADAIGTLALENFVEMRDTVADAKFQLKKRIGFELEKRYPDRFIPRYSMVVFHAEIPYADAYQRGIEQEVILDALAAGIADISKIDWSHAERLMQHARPF